MSQSQGQRICHSGWVDGNIGLSVHASLPGNESPINQTRMPVILWLSFPIGGRGYGVRIFGAIWPRRRHYEKAASQI